MEDLQSFTPLNQILLQDMTDAKRLQITKTLLKEISQLNSIGVFHNNLSAFNVMLSKKSEIKIHETDCLSRQGSVFQASAIMMKNLFYGLTLYKRSRLIEEAHSGYDAFSLSHLIFIVQKGEGSSKYKAILESGDNKNEIEKHSWFKNCEPQLQDCIFYGLEFK